MTPEERERADKEAEEIKNLLESFTEQLTARNYQFFVIVQGMRGRSITASIGDASFSDSLRAIMKDKKYGFSFLRRLLILFG